MAMNLHAIAGPIVGIVSGTIAGQWWQNIGPTTGPDGRRVPGYAAAVPMDMQFQALTGDELQLVESLNIEGLKRAVHLYGDVTGVDRLTKSGGDLLVIPNDLSIPASLRDTIWKVTLVLETWDSSGWCRCAVTKQNSTAV